MKSNKWTTVSSETSLSWIFRQHSPRQQCWRSSSCGPTVSATPPGWFGELQDQLHWPVATPPQRRRKNKADDNMITKCTRHPCASRAPSGSIFSSWRKYCPKTTITLWCTASWRLETEHRNFISSYSKEGTPGHQRNMLSSLRIRTCMVLSHD